MTERVLKSLFDIKIAIDEVDSYFNDRQRTFQEYKRDIILRRAIERNLEIIGEAINRILKEDSGFTITNARKIVGYIRVIRVPITGSLFIFRTHGTFRTPGTPRTSTTPSIFDL